MTKNFVRRWGLGISAILIFGLLLTACSKNNDDYVAPPSAGLMTFNMVADQAPINIALSGNVLPGGALPFTSFSGRYFSIVPGTRVVQSFVNQDLKTLDSTSFTFEQDKYYSLFVTGANNNYRNMVVPDNFDSLTASSGKAYVRYVNAIPDSSSATFTIASNGSNVENRSIGYGYVSEFIAVTPGQLAVKLTNGGNIDADRDVTVQQQKAYTILLTGSPDAINNDEKVQIRYIENGTITD